MKFALSQLVWLAPIIYLGFFHESVVGSEAGLILFVVLGIVTPLVINFLFWFGRNLICVFQDAEVSQQQANLRGTKLRNTPVRQGLQSLTDEELAFLRARLSENDYSDEESPASFIHDDRKNARNK